MNCVCNRRLDHPRGVIRAACVSLLPRSNEKQDACQGASCGCASSRLVFVRVAQSVVCDARLVPFVSRSLSDARGRPRMATNDGNGPFGALAEFFSPSRPASAPLDAQTDHNNTAHNNPANISPVNLDMSSGSGTEPDHDASAHPSARDSDAAAPHLRVDAKRGQGVIRCERKLFWNLK